MIREFSYYIDEGIVKVITPDKYRANNLINDSKRKMKVLERQLISLGIDNELASEYVILCYDILMLIIRAKMLREGYNASGSGAHEAEVAYMKRLNFRRKDLEFMDDLRYSRNGMLYYGTSLDEIYAQKVIEFTKKTYSKLSEISL